MSPKSDSGPEGIPAIRGSDQIVELTSLIETAKILNSSFDYKFILNHIMLASMGKLAISKTAAAVQSPVYAEREKSPFIKIGKGINLNDEIITELFSLDLEGSVESTNVRDSLTKRLTGAGVSRIFAIRSSHKLFGYLFVGKKLLGGGLVPTEIEFVATLCNIAAAAIENASMFQQYKESNFELQRRVQELQTLFELSKEFNLLIDESRALRVLEFAIMGQTGGRKYAVCLVHDSKVNLLVNRIPGIEKCDLLALCSLEQSVRLSDLAKEMPLAKELMDRGAEVVIPFQLQSKTDGLLILGERLSRASYSDAEISFLSSLCNLAAMAIDNARLFEESLAKQRLEEELSLAHTIQEKLLPREMPKFTGCAVETFHIPTKQVGGDYFDVIKLSENLICVAIADVSGKGFPAALLMANLQSAFRALMATGLQLDEIAQRLNDIVYENTDFDKFITFFAAIYDSAGRTLKYVNAGHNYPFLINPGGEVIRLDKGGLILGIMQGIKYQTGEERVGTGDLLYLFTDGVSEALNSEGEQFTEERLEQVLRSNSTFTASEILESIRKEIALFVGDSPQSDDIAQVCVKFSGIKVSDS